MKVIAFHDGDLKKNQDMKTIITCVLCIVIRFAMGQESLNVTIIGTAHQFKEEYQPMQDFQRVQDFIVDLQPDIICIESIPISDTLSLQEVLPLSMERADSLATTLPEMHSLHTHIYKGANYYATYDFWNAYYQWYQAEIAEIDLEAFSKYQYKLANTEYGLFVFPAIQELGIQKLYGIDYRYGENDFLEKNGKVFKKLFFGFKWKSIKTYLKTQKEYKKAERQGKLMEFINSPTFQQSFSKLIDDLPNRLPKSEEAKAVKAYWLKRNQKMANRIVETARSKDARKILLTVGSAHVTHIKRFLEEKGHVVHTYGDFLTSKKQ